MVLGIMGWSSWLWAAAQPVFTYNGFIDEYFQYNTVNNVAPTDRVFDQSVNTFRTALVFLNLTAQDGNVGGVVDVNIGQTADIIAASDTLEQHLNGGFPSDTLLEQAYLSYSPTSQLSIDFGKYVTHMGYEVIGTVNNLNYSNSFLFGYAIPFEASGFKATYTFNNQYNVMVDLMNTGWQPEGTIGIQRCIGFQLNDNPSSVFGFTINGMGGDDVPNGTSYGGLKEVVEGIVNFNPTSQYYLGVDSVYGQAPTSTAVRPYTGLAFYTSYALSTHWKLAARVERLSDTTDETGFNAVVGSVATAVQEGTLTLIHTIGPLTIKAEFRYDEALNAMGRLTPLFADATGSNSHSTQKTYTTGIVYSF